MQESKKISRNYACALIEAVKDDLNLLEILLDELKIINDSISTVKGAKQVFENPAIANHAKKELINRLFSGKINQKLLNFLLLVIDNHRFNLLPAIQNELVKLVNKRKNIVIAEVSSASELDDETIARLKQRLENTLTQNEKVTIETKIDPRLIGGLAIKVNDLVYDGTVKGKLENLKRKLEC